MLLGIGFLVVEAFNPTVVLGLGGLVAFLLGAAMLFKVEASRLPAVVDRHRASPQR